MLPEQILILSSVTTAINRQCQINKTFASEHTVLRAQLSEPVIARALRKDPRSVAARRFENGEKKKRRRRGEEKEGISSPLITRAPTFTLASRDCAAAITNHVRTNFVYTRPSPPSFQRNRIRGNTAMLILRCYYCVIKRYISNRGNLIILHRGSSFCRLELNLEECKISAFFIFTYFTAFYFLFFNSFSPLPFGVFACVYTPKAANYDDFGGYAHRPPIPLLESGPRSVAARSYRELLSFVRTRSC